MFQVMSILVSISWITILASSTVPGAQERPQLISPEAAAQKITQCGAGSVDIRYDDLLQSYVLTVRNVAETQLECIEKAAGYHDVELPPELQRRFGEIRGTRYSAVYREQAVNWLSARDLLDKLPKFRNGVTDEATFSHELERICGPSAEGALQSPYGPRTINPEWVKKMPLPFRPEDAEAMSCLMATASVAGFELNLIGNEASPK